MPLFLFAAFPAFCCSPTSPAFSDSSPAHGYGQSPYGGATGTSPAYSPTSPAYSDSASPAPQYGVGAYR